MILDPYLHFKAWEVIGVLLQYIKGSPGALAESHITDNAQLIAWKKEDPGESLLLSLSGNNNKEPNLTLAKYLFPAKPSKNQDKSVDQDLKPPLTPMTPYFDAKKMQALKADSAADNRVKSAKFATTAIDKIMTLFMKLPDTFDTALSDKQEKVSKIDALAKKNNAQYSDLYKKNKVTIADNETQITNINTDINGNQQALDKLQQQQKTSPNNNTKAQIDITEQRIRGLEQKRQLPTTQNNNLKATEVTLLNNIDEPVVATFRSAKVNYMNNVINLATDSGLYNNYKLNEIDPARMWTVGVPGDSFNPNHLLIGETKLNQQNAAINAQLDKNKPKILYFNAKGKYKLQINAATVLDLDSQLNTVLQTAHKQTLKAPATPQSIELYTYNSNPDNTSVSPSKTPTAKEKNWTAFLKSEKIKAGLELKKLEHVYSKSQMRSGSMNVSLAAFDLWNLLTTIEKYNAGDPNTTIYHKYGAMLDVGASTLTVTENIVNLSAGKLTKKMEQKALDAMDKIPKHGFSALKGKGVLITRFYLKKLVLRLNPAAALYGIGLAIKDMLVAIDKDDTAGIIGQGMAAGGGIILLVSLFANLAWLGWVGFGIALFSFAIIWAFSDDALNTHLEHAVFGQNAGEGKFKDLVANPDQAYLQFMNLIMGPQVKVEQIKDDTFGIGGAIELVNFSVHTPSYIFGSSAIDREFQFFNPVGGTNKTGAWENLETYVIDNNPIWNYVRLYELPNGQTGYKLVVPVDCLKEVAWSAGQFSNLKVRLRVRVYPEGKNATLFNQGQLSYALPPAKLATPPVAGAAPNTQQPVISWAEKELDLNFSYLAKTTAAYKRVKLVRDEVIKANAKFLNPAQFN